MHRNLPVLLPYISRCKNLEILGWFASHAIQPLLPNVLPLQTVSVSIDRQDTRSARWFSTLLTSSPILSHMHWIGPPVSAPWSQLTYLSIAPSNPSEFFRILEQLVNVIDLHLVTPEPEFGAEFASLPARAHILPSVLTFSLHHHPCLLNFITLPNLQNLILANCGINGASTNHFLDRSAFALYSLELQSPADSIPHNLLHPTIGASLTRLGIPSEDLSIFILERELETPGTLPHKILLLRDVDLCFRIDPLEGIPTDETTGILASLLHSWFPCLTSLDLDLEVYTQDELESHAVDTPLGGFTVVRPTWLRVEYEQWWISEEGQQFQAILAADGIRTRDTFPIKWECINGILPQRENVNLFSRANNMRTLNDWAQGPILHAAFGRALHTTSSDQNRYIFPRLYQ
ncbi:hypothetical protein B0H11DRAFT_2263984 [Mycena galericulata]|nr:hypothetical protein B0H11DRAFT_2263984 [Mycena galericulata]